MLPVKKEDIPLPDNSPSAMTGFVKILGSIQGLQQRLADFSYGEVSIAEAKVRMLVKQLRLLRDKVDNLAQRKLEIDEISRIVQEIPLASFDQVKLDKLEKHPQLHAILQFSRLIGAEAHAATLPSELGGNEPFGSTAAAEPRTPSATQAADHRDTNQPAGEIAAAQAAVTGKDHAALPGAESATAGEDRTVANELPAFMIPSERFAASEAPNLSGSTRDWTFDPPEAALTQVRDFEFPEDSPAAPELIGQTAAQRDRFQAEPALDQSISDNVAEGRARLARQVAPVRAARSEETKLDESKALVPAQYDFDQRLLEDVIKNYGDFTTAANLPAVLASSSQPAPAREPEPAPAQFTPTAPERKVSNVKKSGDLDRQLKKIIKDYGEYDIYERKSALNLKKGGMIAFALLGLILVILYLFKASAAVTQKSASPAPHAQTIHPLPADTRAANEGFRAAPDGVTSRPTALTDSKQNP